ncbi:hypothetical protein [Actinoplanes utahensis]|uniref:Uncharacterized protein n=1 Tax=Actinoplanes utahensis TaxID=1869 RepID=A0A0A6UFJ7_ACTUT|nr:hypothetical protein [Actinoplanes utahensis]KHD74785.1 hypothetical protein MB27_26485 [Actinoplanes utahensis]
MARRPAAPTRSAGSGARTGSDDEQAFREFVTSQMASLRKLAYMTCGDWHTAEDAVANRPAALVSPASSDRGLEDRDRRVGGQVRRAGRDSAPLQGVGQRLGEGRELDQFPLQQSRMCRNDALALAGVLAVGGEDVSCGAQRELRTAPRYSSVIMCSAAWTYYLVALKVNFTATATGEARRRCALRRRDRR